MQKLVPFKTQGHTVTSVKLKVKIGRNSGEKFPFENRDTFKLRLHATKLMRHALDSVAI